VSSVTVTSWLLVVAAFLALIIPLAIRRRTAKHREQADRDKQVAAREAAKEQAAEANREADRKNFTSINAAIQKREAELDRQLAESTREHNQEIRTLKTEHAAETRELRNRIEVLEKQVEILRGLVNERRSP
jgi:flagellar biosynthesis/type III secretory pathway M-ring protein FliF/YscJ